MEVTLTPELEEYVANKVATGCFTSSTEVLVAGLESLRDQEDATERWLRDEVLPALEELDADPRLAVPIGVAFAEIREQHALRVKSVA